MAPPESPEGSPEPVRISDVERDHAVERLNAFYSEGRLTLEEYSARLDEIYSARTDHQLEETFRGLPRFTPTEVRPVEIRERRDLRAGVDRFVGTSTPALICTAIWAMTSQGYFWPEWVWFATALGWLGGYGEVRRRRRRRARKAASRIDRDRLDRGREPIGAGVHEPRPILTAVFVDIVGSTEKATVLGDSRWRELLRRFEHVVDGELADHHGRKLFTKGDEVVATFRSPAQAINYSASLISAVQPLDLEVRAGIHTGEMEGRNKDLSGITLHIGQRVSAIASASEILVSSTVRDIAYGSGIQFVDRGEHELRGLTGTWHLYAVGSTAPV